MKPNRNNAECLRFRAALAKRTRAESSLLNYAAKIPGSPTNEKSRDQAAFFGANNNELETKNSTYPDQAQGVSHTLLLASLMPRCCPQLRWRFLG